MPVNPAKKVTPAARTSTILQSNRPLLAVILAAIAGYAAAGDLSVVAVPLTLAAAVVLPRR